MSPQFASWSHSAHREYTNCNSCHVPHDNIFNTYYFKAKDGLRHATIFTLRAEPQVIQIKEAGKEAVQQNCVRCHDHLLVGDELLRGYAKPHPDVRERKCWDCHRHVPHGRVNSLSSTPYARVPVPESPIPEWLENVMENEQ
jgi:cytochrome c nitrite reductase small subunit